VQDDGHHEVSTLWMGAPGQSVTDSFLEISITRQNVYVAGPALFRVSQSISYRNALVDELQFSVVASQIVAPSTTFKPLFDESRHGCQMSGEVTF
jgi:hypothetical protein